MTNYSHFKYQITFFGQINIQALFQNYISKILTKKLDIFVIVYLNNFFIYIESKKEKYI